MLITVLKFCHMVIQFLVCVTFLFTAHRKLISRHMPAQTKDQIAVILFLLKSVPGVQQVEMGAMREYQVKMLMA